MPITPFIGVRISWLMFARNSDFARVAASASSLARARSRVRSATSAFSVCARRSRLATRNEKSSPATSSIRPAHSALNHVVS